MEKKNILSLLVALFATLQVAAQTYDNLWKQAEINAQKDILKLINNKGSVENSEFQSIKKLSEDREKEALKYKEEYEKASKQILEKDMTVKKLQDKLLELENEHINNTSHAKTKEDLEDELRIVTEAKIQAEKEKNKLENNLEKLKSNKKKKRKRMLRFQM